MTRVLVVKMTSMGDVLHLLPALNDLQRQFDGVSVDWMVEEAFAEIPQWHPLVERVVPVSTRRWRKLSIENLKSFWRFLRTIREVEYDYIIDAQGLMKSAFFSRFARLKSGGQRIGFSSDSIKESPAAWLYSNTVSVNRQAHAVDRLRNLICGGFNASPHASKQDYGIGQNQTRVKPNANSARSIFLFHGTTWDTKHLPLSLWMDIAKKLIVAGFEPLVTWGNDAERERAETIVKSVAGVRILAKSSLSELKQTLAMAEGAIAVDTGLGHLAAALGVPCVSLYGATDPSLTGTYGAYQTHLSANYQCSPCLLKTCKQIGPDESDPPCYATISAQTVVDSLQTQISARNAAIGV